MCVCLKRRDLRQVKLSFAFFNFIKKQNTIFDYTEGVGSLDIFYTFFIIYCWWGETDTYTLKSAVLTFQKS